MMMRKTVEWHREMFMACGQVKNAGYKTIYSGWFSCVVVSRSHLVMSTLGDPMDCSPSCSSVHGILQAGILEWVAISFSRGFSNPGIEPRSPALQADSLPSEPLKSMYHGLVIKSCPALATPWTVACQAPVSKGFSRQYTFMEKNQRKVNGYYHWLVGLEEFFFSLLWIYLYFPFFFFYNE